jgi:hypothetical protein
VAVEPSRRGSRGRRAFSAGMLALLSTSFSCSYGDDDRRDQKKDDDEPAEQGALLRLLAGPRGLRAAEIAGAPLRRR